MSGSKATGVGSPLRPPHVPGSLPDVSRAVIVHHWDADGISSAAMMKMHLEGRGAEVLTMPPTLGNFFLEKEELQRIRETEPDLVAVVDICIARERVLEMKELLGKDLWIFDHHKIDPIPEVMHVNPVAYGFDARRWPSASFIVSRWLKRKDDILTYLGVAGDWEERAMGLSDVYPGMERAIAEYGLAFPDLQRMVSLIDAPYKMGLADKVAEAVDVLTDPDVVSAVDSRSDWQDSLFRVDDLLVELSGGDLEDLGKRVFRKTFSNPASVISPLARRLSRLNPDKIVMVVNEGYFGTRDQVYVRTALDDVDLGAFIDSVRPWAFSVGGKKEVAGVVIEKGEMPRLLEALFSALPDTDPYSKKE